VRTGRRGCVYIFMGRWLLDPQNKIDALGGVGGAIQDMGLGYW
jgi:hypothetical protein